MAEMICSNLLIVTRAQQRNRMSMSPVVERVRAELVLADGGDF